MNELQAFFQELDLERALEAHPRLALLPEDTLWRMVVAGQADDVIEWGRQRHMEIDLEAKDRFRYGWRGDPAKSRELGGSWKRVVDAVAEIKRENPLSIPKILCMGGNGSSKSEFAGWYAIKQMVEKKDFRVAALCPSEKQAREVLMSRMFWNLPAEWRPEQTGKLKTGVTGNISFSEKMGFTENIFILPNGSRCTFYFYEDGDPKSLEGVELDLVLADEEVPLNWLEAAEYRLVRRAGALMAMFTPISGETPTVAYFRGELSKVIEDREAELLPIVAPGLDRIDGICADAGTGNGQAKACTPTRQAKACTPTNEAGGSTANGQRCEKLPMLETGADKTKRIVYFWTQDCPYPATNYQTLKEELKTKRASRAKIMERAYGIPKKVRDAAFPLFSADVHCLRMGEVVGADQAPELTWWHVMDPAHGRNPFMQWWGCDRLGRLICVREWPQQDDYIPGVGMPGAWARLSSKAKKLDGDKGEAQESWGLSYQQIVDEIQRVEEWLSVNVEKREAGSRITVFRRILDSRLGSAETHGTSIQKEFAKLKIFFDFASGKNLNVTTAENEATAGITLINDKLAYNADKPVTALNCPKLYVVYEAPADEHSAPKGCANTAFALKTWTGQDKEHGACKDPVDCTHYFLRDEPRFIEPRRAVVARGGGWGGYGS